MNYYIVIETEDGLSVAEVPAGSSADEAATRSGGVLVDSGPYKTYEDAIDAMKMTPDSEKERAKLRD